MRQRGFTLAELLIALGILGVIATFTIPKVLQSQQDQQRRAIFKETIATIETIMHDGWIQGEISSSSNGGYILSRMNAVKVCNTHADSEGCWAHAIPSLEGDEPGAILHNGATVGGFSDGAGVWNWVFIDWNGAEGANTEGDDQLRLALCYDPDGACGASDEVKSGTARVLNGYAASMSLYDEIFSD